MNQYNTLEEICEVVKWACNHLDVPVLYDNIEVKWNHRYRTVMGRAFFYVYKKNIIFLSSYIWAYAIPQQRYETVVHEACHLIARYLYGSRIRPHGKEWQLCMIRCGLKPKRCHTVKSPRTTGALIVQPHERPIEVYCDCRTHYITKNRCTRMQKGAIYKCNKCNTKIRFLSQND